MPTAMAPRRDRLAPARDTAPAEVAEQTTRRRILRLVVEAGPVSAAELARDLELSTAGVRRHVAALEDAGQIAVHMVAPAGAPRRGRPARRYVATDRGQAAMSNAYSDLAAEALAFLAQVGGPDAVQAFADRRVAQLEARLAGHDAAGVLQGAPGTTAGERVEVLASGLAAEGYAASVRPVPGGRAVQLCQGHCPVLDVAAQHPQLCEAEARLFSRLLGVHVQRLSTLAAGGHVCTTHVPVAAAAPGPSDRTTTSTTTRTTTYDDNPAASDRPARGTVEGTR